MSLYTGSENGSFSSISSTRTRTSSVTTASDATPERMSDCIFYRNLWWDKGEFSEGAKWEEVTLPYVLATGIAIEEYEKRTEEFKIHGCWEWSDGKVLIYEFPSMPHEVGIGAVTRILLHQCDAVAFTNAEIYSF
ncbi:16754_t:CDS:2, partial [Funneliformis geosporum]